ncbi:MAG: helix-turn-helix domain-containing protein [Alphaproteobacteria bacterium]
MQLSDKIDESVCFLKQVGENLRYYRKNKSLTQKQMAEKLSMATITYGLIEQGKAGTTLKTLYKISGILGVSPAQLLMDKEEILFTKEDVKKLYIQKEPNQCELP